MGHKGDKGDQGPAGPSGVIKAPRTVLSNVTTVAPGTSSAAVVKCPAGTVITGGGFQFRGGDSSGLIPVTSHTVLDSWIVVMNNTATTERSFQAQVVCLPTG